jgi:ABC-type sulfate transport system permease component
VLLVRAEVRDVNTRPRPWILTAVLVYAAIVLIAPLVALVTAFIGADPARSMHALIEDDARGALVNSLVLAVIAVVVNGVFGVAAGIVWRTEREAI